MKPSDDRESAAVFDFIDDYLGDLEAGRTHELAHYLARYPGFEEAIAREFLTLRATNASDDSPSTPAVHVDGEERRLGPYRLLRELGRGGQGSVWLAEDVRLARKVALKVLASRFETVSDDRRRRFRREAEVIARMEHPGICPIYDADIDADTPWIAMRYVEGSTLAQILGESRRARDAAETPSTRLEDSPDSEVTSEWPPKRALDVQRTLLLFERCARALHAAHEAGVIHRDFKPGNVIVTPDGKPVILDFGLARDEGSDQGSITETGDVFGTPAYMSPEQLRLASHELDRRTDVYSLGIALYEALTLERPFAHEAKAALYTAIQSDPPRDPRDLNDALSLDIKVVLETALAKERQHRYPSALELAEDLRRIREYEPIHARPAGWTLRLQRWARRHPALAISVPGTIVALTAGLLVTLSLLRAEKRAVTEKTAAVKRAEDALAAEKTALSYAVGRHLAQRCEALTPTDPTAALTLGIEAVERAPNDLTRAALLGALQNCRLRLQIGFREIGGFGQDMALSPDGTTLVVAHREKVVNLFDARDGRLLKSLRVTGGPAQAVAWLSTTQIVAAYSDHESKDSAGKPFFTAGRVVTWDVASERILAEVEFPARPTQIELDMRGSRLLVCGASADDTLVYALFDLPALTATCSGAVGALASSGARLARDGRSLFVWSPGKDGLKELDGADGTLLHSFELERVCVVAANERRIVAGCEDGGVYVVRDDESALAPGSVAALRAPNAAQAADTSAGARPPAAPGTTRPGGRVQKLAIHGSRLLAAFRTGEGSTQGTHVVHFDLDTRRALRELPLPEDLGIVDLAFDDSGQRVAIAASDRSVLLFDIAGGAPTRFATTFYSPQRVYWSRDGKTVWTLPNAQYVHAWHADGLPDVPLLAPLEGARTDAAAISSDGTQLLTARGHAPEHSFELWDITADGFRPSAVAWTRPAKLPEQRESSRVAQEGPVPVGAFEREFPDAITLGFAPGGRWGWRSYASGTDFEESYHGSGTAEILPLRAGMRPGPSFLSNSAPRFVVTSRDGRWVLLLDSAGVVQAIELGDAPGNVRSFDFRPGRVVVSVAIDAQSRNAALGLVDGEVLIVELATGAVVRTLNDPSVQAVASLVAFRPESDELASFHEDLRLRVWNTQTGELKALRANSDGKPGNFELLFPPRSLEYSRDGRLLLVTGRNGGGAVRIFRTDGYTAITYQSSHKRNLSAGEFSADGRYVLTASRDGSVLVRESVTGRVFVRREFPGRAVRCAHFDGRVDDPHILTMTDDGAIQLWPMDPLPSAQRRFQRKLDGWELDREKEAALPLEYP